MEISNPASIKT